MRRTNFDSALATPVTVAPAPVPDRKLPTLVQRVFSFNQNPHRSAFLGFIAHWLPNGQAVSEPAWRARHRAVIILLWLHTLPLFVLGLKSGHNPGVMLISIGSIGLFASLASSQALTRSVRSAMASLGLMSCSAVLVYFTNGRTEAHFHFFVAVTVIALYQAWLPFLLAIGFVLVHHSVMGIFMARHTFDHASAWENPWRWAAIHTGFVLAASIASLGNWRLIETEQQHRVDVERAGRDALEKSESRYRGFLAGSFDAFVLFKPLKDASNQIVDFLYLDLNEPAARMLGRERSALIGRRVCDIVPVVRTNGVFDRYARVFTSGVPIEEEFAIELVGEPLWIRHQVVLAGDAIAVTARNLTKQKHAENEIRFQAELLNHVPAAVIGTDATGIVTHWNTFAEGLYGWSRDEAFGQPIYRLLTPEAEPNATNLTIESLLASSSATNERVVKRKDGTDVPIQVIVGPLVDTTGQAVGLVGVSVDVTERKQTEARLLHLAYYDQVTGLPNRTYLIEALQRALDDPTPCTIALFSMDLDRFKVVNDSLGHAMGDRLLQLVAERLMSATRGNDTLARLGGDEYMLLCVVDDPSNAKQIANRMVAALAAPFVLDDRDTVVGGSVGVAVADNHGIDAGEFLRRADVALYEAKAAGRGRAALFDPESNRRALTRHALESDLRRAITNGELELHYQPIVNLREPHLHGVEALVRWRHPERGVVSPGDFISLAVESGLIVPIGDWVLAEACRQGAQWKQAYPSLPLSIAVNVAPAQLHGGQFLSTLWRELSTSGLPPHALTLEMTEDAFAESPEQMLEILQTCKSLGVQLALDDFGTGYSSLSRLHTFPLDTVKLDRSFIAKLGSDPTCEAIVRSVVMVGRSLNLQVVAEGIESDEQRHLVLDLGCDRGQGYLFGRPVTGHDITTLLDRQLSPTTNYSHIWSAAEA